VLAERVRIARELHDSVSQTLYAIVLGASRARTLLQQIEASQVQELIDDVLELANVGQSELRALMTEMRSPQFVSGGLGAALAALAADVRKRHGLDVRVSALDDADLPAATQDALVMIVREALHNVVKHAGARRVEIVLERDRDELRLLIGDDGRGFEPGQSRPGHFGLYTMGERASAVGGRLEVLSGDGRGTRVRMWMPLRVGIDG
jgi:signal transduction histidine kinase